MNAEQTLAFIGHQHLDADQVGTMGFNTSIADLLEKHVHAKRYLTATNRATASENLDIDLQPLFVMAQQYLRHNAASPRSG